MTLLNPNAELKGFTSRTLNLESHSKHTRVKIVVVVLKTQVLFTSFFDVLLGDKVSSFE